MNYIDEIFKRCDIEAIGSYLMYGDGATEGKSGNYCDRLNEADFKLDNWLREQFSEERELDRQTSFVYSLISEIQNVYFQVGLRAGFMLSRDVFSESKRK